VLWVRFVVLRTLWILGTLLGVWGCGSGTSGHNGPPATPSATHSSHATTSSDAAGVHAGRLPLVLVADVDLPGGATRFDYQDIDRGLGHLVIAHMNDGAVLVVKLSDGSVLKELAGIPVARGVIVADEVGTIFVTSSPSQLVLIDNTSLTEITRVDTGLGPDGVGWDPPDKVVGVSDQADGALSLIADAGKGKRTQVRLGTATGNAVFDPTRGWFWITVVTAKPPDQLVGVDPTAAKIKSTIELPGCGGAHGLRLHPDGQSAFIACESNDVLARVALGGAHTIATASTGSGADVLAIDPGLGWLYVAAESGDLTVFDISRPGLALIGHDHPGNNAHSVAVDPVSHRVFFPLMAGPKGTPILRIMRPTDT
jgi:DNA-binding beta-propeller fold protein YncE